ncbi:nuclear factor NF-kappa-B p110 subunit isoform X1 [Schistocerca piceifrons]|uniref:nuclear factor NF-kappa-B p110 subunit isoform X1 n=2 Tax=Schistocerca piceifrons TaxID=274613 RepID=UPI001F5ECD37|nr:nuclear factor NF-kappa-B p110 subunit isoform X1 [Schistocerca piceifrons]
MSQVAYTALPMIDNFVNISTTLNVSDYESSATTSSMSSPNMFSASSPDTPESFLSPIFTINQEDLGFNLPCLGQPHLEIVEQPVDKFRFRYKSEMMGTHGSILAKSSDKSRKRVYPTVRLQNYSGEAIVRCSLYTAHPTEYMRTPHTHRLVVRVGNDDKDDPHELKVNAANKYTAVFQGMGIIHTAKKHIAEELLKKKRALKLEQLRQHNMNISSLPTKDETEIRAEAESEAKRMNLNSVTLCFEAFIEGPGGVIKPICQPVFSTPINNMKSALTGELKICRIDKNSSSCLGGEEVFILVEKVGKKNIKIKFFELDEEDNEIWCDFGKFSELDVHHQYAIVFRTPPYRDTEITDNVNVYLQLYRPTDGDCSEPIQFSYKPSDRIGRKRQRMSVNDSYNRHISQENELARNLLNLEVSGNNPSFSGIATTSTSLDAYLCDPRSNSAEFQEFFGRLSGSEILQEYLGALPQGPQNLTVRQAYGGDLVTDSASNRTQQSTGKTPVGPSKFYHTTDSVNVKDCPDEPLLARQIVDEMKRNASLRKPVFTERVLKMFSQKSHDGNTALHAAILHKQEVLLRHMLDVLAREPQHYLLNCPNDSQQTPLHTAAAGNPVSVKWLLNAGADPDRQDENGDTPLHVAVKHHANLCVEELLTPSNYKSEMKPDVNKKNSTGWTPLHVGVLHKNLGAIERLITAGADVNEEDTNGRTVLHFAADGDDEKIAEYLVKHTNIDVNKKDKVGYTAFDRARARGGRAAKVLCQILDHTKWANLESVEGQMEGDCNIGLDLSRVKEEPEDSDDELHIDEDDDEDDDEEEEDDDDDNTDKESNSTEMKSPVPDEVENKHIMSLLQGVAKSPERRTQSPEITEVKEEMFPSPVSECTIPDENGLFNAETLSQLCDILDSSGSWQDLAELLGYTFLIASIKDNTSPSRLLFNYADVDGNATVREIRNFLDVLDEHKAVELVDLMLASQES